MQELKMSYPILGQERQKELEEIRNLLAK